jgi:hypothetical protein
MKKRISQFMSETAGAGFLDQKTLEDICAERIVAPPDVKVRTVQNPLLIMFEEPSTGAVICHIHPAEGHSHEHYGILICDLVRHVANAFDVDESDVWRWIDAERFNPTDTPKRVA